MINTLWSILCDQCCDINTLRSKLCDHYCAINTVRSIHCDHYCAIDTLWSLHCDQYIVINTFWSILCDNTVRSILCDQYRAISNVIMKFCWIYAWSGLQIEFLMLLFLFQDYQYSVTCAKQIVSTVVILFSERSELIKNSKMFHSFSRKYCWHIQKYYKTYIIAGKGITIFIYKNVQGYHVF